MDKLLFWLGLGAAQKGAASKEIRPRLHWVVSLVAGILLPLLITAGGFVLSVSQNHFGADVSKTADRLPLSAGLCCKTRLFFANVAGCEF